MTDGPSSEFVFHRDLRLHHLDWGNLGAEPLLLLHGIRLHAHCWNHYSRRIRERNRVLALDARGHGDSDWAPGEYHLHDFYEDLAAVMDGRGIESATLVGHSLGGRVAMLFAHLHPERVRRLVLVDIGPSLPVSAAGQDFSRVTETAHPRDFGSYREAEDYLAGILRRAPRALIEESVRHGMSTRQDGRLIWKYDPSLGGPPLPRPGRREWDLWEVAASINCPTLLLYGEHSQVVSPEIAERMERDMGDCRARRVANAGHALFTEQPEAFAEMVTRFLAESE